MLEYLLMQNDFCCKKYSKLNSKDEPFFFLFFQKSILLKCPCFCWSVRIAVLTHIYMRMHTHKYIHIEARPCSHSHCQHCSWGCAPPQPKRCRNELLILITERQKLSMKCKQATSCRCEVWSGAGLGQDTLPGLSPLSRWELPGLWWASFNLSGPPSPYLTWGWVNLWLGSTPS